MTDDSSEQTDAEAFLAANPDKTLRDYKGKGFNYFHPFDKHLVLEGEKPWHKLDKKQVREAATSDKARFLSKGERQAAGRDPALVWDERTRSYRRRVDTAPALPEASSDGV